MRALSSGYRAKAAKIFLMTLSSCVCITIMEDPEIFNDDGLIHNNASHPTGNEFLNKIQLESNSAKDIQSKDGSEEISRDWQIPEFLGNILPSTSFFSSPQADETGIQSAPNVNNSSYPGFLSRLFSNIIIERPSVFRVQFYNSDNEDGSSSSGDDDDDNSTVPNAVFGSPLCLGLCLPIQVFAENTSVHFLSDKQYSIFPPGKTPAPEPEAINPTPLYPSKVGGDKVNLSSFDNKPSNSEVVSVSETVTNEDDSFGWFSSWIPIAPSLSEIQNSIQLPEFPKLSYDVLDLIG